MEMKKINKFKNEKTLYNKELLFIFYLNKNIFKYGYLLIGLSHI